MRWLQNDFRLYCERKGIALLRDDMRYIENRLGSIPVDRQRSVMREYVKIWLKAMTENLGQGVGRKLANEYLRGED